MPSLRVTDETFETEVLQAQKPVLIDFWAEWCGPCKQISPAIEEIADEMGAAIQVVKLNIDESQQVASKYNIRGIPTLMVIRDGKVVATKSGAMPKGKIVEWLTQTIAT
jgi:thioredoxin 1